jgi:2-dehydro-3-deoxyphosphogluconate aldolase/(4S)-4-hydroxy-2-oxoglutarate aldolase
MKPIAALTLGFFGLMTSVFAVSSEQTNGKLTLGDARLPVEAIVAIVRRPKVDPVRRIEHLFQHGIRLVEVTMDTSDAVEVLEYFRTRVPAKCLLGAGTVTDVELAEAALGAGASFIVTPNIDLDVIRTVRAHGIPVIPGALTPTEIWTASKSGADFIKVFPASAVGPRYFRELRGPFAQIPFMASGGVSLENAAMFVKLMEVALKARESR